MKTIAEVMHRAPLWLRVVVFVACMIYFPTLSTTASATALLVGLLAGALSICIFSSLVRDFFRYLLG